MHSVKAPSARAFSAAFTADMKSAAKALAGKDGKLSYSEVKQAIATDRAPRHLADNLANYFEKGHGRALKSGVSIEKLAKDAKAYADRAASAAAGKDGVISAKDAKALPKDLLNDVQAQARRLHVGLDELMDGKTGGVTAKLSERDLDSPKVPRAAAEALWNLAIDEDGKQTYAVVYSGRDRKTVVGYAVTTKYSHPGGGFPAVQVEIVDRNGRLIAEGSRAK